MGIKSVKATALGVAGGLIPLCVRNVVVLFLRPDKFPSFDLNFVSHELMMFTFHGVPFAVVGHLVFGSGRATSFVAKRQDQVSRIADVAAAVVMLVTIVGIHVSVCVSIYGPGRSSSTSPIALVFAPGWGIVVGVVGYIIVKVIGSVVLRSSETQYPPLCDECGYSLRGLHGARCPECGAEFKPNVLDTVAPDQDNRDVRSS